MLTRAEWRVVRHAAMLRPWVGLALRGASFDRVMKTLDRPLGTARTGHLAPDRIGALVESVGRRWPRDGGCLRNAIVGAILLRRRGFAATVTLGVRRGTTLQAHAWVTVQGQVVVGAAEQPGYTPIWRSDGG